MLEYNGLPNGTDLVLTVRPDTGPAAGTGPAGSAGSAGSVEVVVPAGMIRTLVGRRVYDDRVRRLEEMSPAELCEDALGREVLAWTTELT